jgi:hypothetical protein
MASFCPAGQVHQQSGLGQKGSEAVSFLKGHPQVKGWEAHMPLRCYPLPRSPALPR